MACNQFGCLQELVCTLEQQATFSNTENLYQSYQTARPRFHLSMRKFQSCQSSHCSAAFMLRCFSVRAARFGAQALALCLMSHVDVAFNCTSMSCPCTENALVALVMQALYYQVQQAAWYTVSRSSICIRHCVLLLMMHPCHQTHFPCSCMNITCN